MKFLQSKAFIFFLLLFLSFLLFSLGKAVYRRHQINQEIDKIKADIGRLEGENNKLLDTVEYLKTDEFLEKEARDKLNMSKQGEKVIALPFFEDSKPEQKPVEEPDEQTLENKEIEENTFNPKAWWNYFFGEDKVMGNKK